MVKVIGLTGSIGAGKGEVGKYLASKYGYVQLTIGDVVRDYLREHGMEITRDNSVRVSEEMRQKYGVTYWVQKVVDKILKEGYDKVVVDGVRLPTDDKLLRDSFGKDYILIKVDADPSIRFERLKKRARPGFPKTLEEFKFHEQRENKVFKLDQTFKLADAVVDNSTTLEELYKRVDELLTKRYPQWL